MQQTPLTRRTHHRRPAAHDSRLGALRTVFSTVLLAVLMLVGGFATSSQAAMTMSINSSSGAVPEDKSASAFSNFSVEMSFGGTDYNGNTVKKLEIDMPKGQLGVMQNATVCTPSQLDGDNCPAGSEIGAIDADAKANLFNISVEAPGSIYRMATTGTEVARIGQIIRPKGVAAITGKIMLQGTIRLADDYHLKVLVDNMPDSSGGIDMYMTRLKLTMFGRANGGNGFFFNPAECTTATTAVRTTAYSGTVMNGSASYTPTNCSSVPFTPTLAFNPNPSKPSTPQNFQVIAGTSDNTTTAAKMPSPFKKVTMTLPNEVQLSGAANAGGTLAVCTPAQFGLATPTSVSTCPAGARVGGVVMNSPLVGAVNGDVFLAQPSGGGNNLVQLFIVAQQSTAADALRVKLSAQVAVDPVTGVHTITLDDLPAQPVSNFTFTFDASSPPVRQPRTCGTYAGGTLAATPYSTGTAKPTIAANYNVTAAPCPAAGAFNPTIDMTLTPTSAGAVNATGVTSIKLPIGNEPIANLTASLPSGLLANLTAISRCTIAQANADTCPATSQVGVAAARIGQDAAKYGSLGAGSKIYLTDAPDSESLAGLLIVLPVNVGPISLGTIKVQASLRLRPDFGIDVVSDVPTTVRGLQADLQQLDLTLGGYNGFYLTVPSTCTGNTISGRFTSSLGTTKTSSASTVTVAGCGSLAYAPSLAFAVGSRAAGGASDFTATVTVPAGAQSTSKKLAITMPDGVSLSPSASSDGALAGCSDAQFTINDFANTTCPSGSNIGTVTLSTPSVGALTGVVHLGTAVPGHTARVLVEATSTTYGSKVRMKLEGLLDVNPTTGKLTATFDNLPKASFTSFSMTLRGGNTPVMSMPRTCGTFNGTSVMTPWSGGTNATPSGSITLDQNCSDATSFAPSATLNVGSMAAGKSTTLTTQVDVPQRHRPIEQLELQLPAGLLAKVDGMTRCSLVLATAGACPAAARIGSVAALAGQGTSPGSFTGDLYVTDPPAPGAAVGLAVALPAAVGPVDLGTVTTIASATLRPSDYGLDVTAEIPTSQVGVPLHLRRLTLTIDKSNFLTNALTCGASKITETLTGSGGGSFSKEYDYQATGCASLGFNPSLSFGAAPAQAAGASAMTTTITAPAGTDAAPQGALKKAVVNLPAGVSLSPSINSGSDLTGCSAAQFAPSDFTDPTCAAGSAIGTATIVSPLVGSLTGSVYLAETTPGGAIAGLYLDAKSTQFGSGVRVKLSGQVDVNATTGQTTATFDNAPAVAFTSFSLAMRGGTKPALSVPRTCGTTTGGASLTPQSGTAVSRTAGLTLASGCTNDASFAPTGSVALSTPSAGQNTSVTTVVNVPAGHRELAHVDVALPTGLLANLQGKTRCSVTDATAGTCAAGTEIGSVSAEAGQGTTPGAFTGGKVYLVDPPHAGDIVGLGISLPVHVGPIDLGAVNVVASVTLRDDYGIDISADVPRAIKGIPMYLRKLTIAISKSGFLFNPSTCGGTTANLSMTSASYSGSTSGATDSSSLTINNCAALDFDPSVAFSAGASPVQAGEPAAFTTTLTLPSTPAQSSIGTVEVNLPSGVSLSPSINSDDQLVGCADGQFDATHPFAAPTCPAGAKIGTAAITTTAIGALSGDVYLASAAPGHVAKLFVYAAATQYPNVRVKLAGTVDTNASTGVVTASFTGLPDVPVTSFALTFRGGTNAAISMPRTCGTVSGSASLTPKSGGDAVQRSGGLTVDQCPDAASFTPTFTHTIAPTTAGVSSALTATVNVPARHRALDELTLNLPAGLLAQVDGRARCSLVAATAGTCPAATKIGSVTAKAGQGSQPGSYAGDLYLTDAPQPGDVIGIAVDLPAVAGPVDLGVVTSIASVRLRPSDYGVDVVAPVPTTVQGVPLYLRQLTLNVNKSGFLSNPRTCGTSSTAAAMHAQGGGAAVTASQPFQSTNCANLSFNPSLSFGASPAQAGGASALTTTLTAPAGSDAAPQAAMKRASVVMPDGVSLSPSINGGANLTGCSVAQIAAHDFSEPTCPAGSEIGTAAITVPQVGAMTGKVYLAQVTPSGAIAGLYLDAKSTQFGSAVRVKLAGEVSVNAATGVTTATFDNAPAVAFTSFALTMRGGATPALSMPRTCGTPSGSATLTTQAGASANRSATLTLSAGCDLAAKFDATGSVSLGELRAGQDTSVTTVVNVPSGHRELRKLAISLPAGVLAKIDGAPRCSVAAATAGTCSAATEVGSASATAGQGTSPGAFGGGKVYLVDPPSSNAMVGLGISLPVQVGPIDLGSVNVVAAVTLRDDYGIDITADVPTTVQGIPMYLRSLTVNVSKSAFLFNPSTCETRSASIAMTSATYSGSSSTANAANNLTFTQCGNLGFNPTVAFSATPPAAGGAGALRTTITLPASPAQAALKRASVQLPTGVSLSPSIDSDGTLTGCTDVQFGAATPFAQPTCPSASRIGDLEITSGTVGELTGGVYLAATGGGHLARLYAFARSTDFPGAGVKLTGTVDVDPATGVATADFSGAPEVPFTAFAMSFRGGTSPVLSLPRSCGTPSGSASLTSYANATAVTRSATLTIDQQCSGSFAPTATVTSSPTAAAASTALTTTITVPDRSDELSAVSLSLPAGLIARIDGHARCSLVSATAGTCPSATKVGTLSAKAGQGTTPGSYGGGSVYLTDAPSPGDLVGLAVALPVQVGKVGGTPIVDLGTVTAIGGVTLRDDYGIDLTIEVPTKVRGIPMYTRQLTLAIDADDFLVNPPTCTGNAISGTLSSAQGGSASLATSLTVDDCSAAPFAPSVAFSASPARPAAAVAFTTQLSLPAGDQAPLKTAAVTLPAGVSLTASANADGQLVGCTNADFHPNDWTNPSCPAGSDIGTVSLQTPSVGTLTGRVYLADSAAPGSIARVLLDATSTTYGAKVRVKLAGSIEVDSATGATTATFDGLPPVAFSSFTMTLRGGAAPVMSMPRSCGSFSGQAVLTPHAGSAATKSGGLTLNASCPPASQFGPSLALALSPNNAGGAGHLTTSITVPAGDQELSRVKLNMPEGLTAKLKGAARCTIADAQDDDCAAETQIGTVSAQVGVAGAPYTQTGKVYLTEGRTGNVAGMAIVLPAKVGPIDLGKVITIADVQLHSPDLALQIDATVPTAVRGVRLDLRQLDLTIDKDDFIINPSACGTLPGGATLSGKQGASATASATIAVADGSCAAQSFDPQIAFDASNKKPGQASDFTVDITMGGGSGPVSPFQSASVRLPAGTSVSASAGARGDLAGCTDAQFHQDDLTVANSCPAGSEIGTVLIKTDLVGELSGKAYLAPATSGNIARIFLEGVASDLANLTVRLVGEVRVDEHTGATDAVFPQVPAIAVTEFRVVLRGGDAPVLALPRECGTAQGGAAFTPVNGSATQTRTASLVLSSDCPDPDAFSPTTQIDRTTTAAGQPMNFTTTVDVPAGNQELRTLNMTLPAGLLGKISNVPWCSLADARAGSCGAASQIGTVSADVGIASAPYTVSGGAYLVEGDASHIARLGLVLPTKVGPVDLGNIVTIADLTLRGDYGLNITASDIPTRVKGVRVDLHRFRLAINRADFMVNPVACGNASARTTLGSAQGGSASASQALATTGCDQLSMNAALAFAADPASPAAASRVTTQVRVSADAGKALDALRSVRVVLPEGVSLSPSAGARGDLAECSAAGFAAADITTDAACPAGAQVGTVRLNSPMVGELTGTAYLGPRTGGHFAQLFLQAKAPAYPSLRVKLAGTLDVDATTGRLTTTFSDLPQVQVSEIDIAMRGGDAPVLSLPRTCGQYGAALSATRYGGATSDASGALTLNQDCPADAFTPSVQLTGSTAQAAATTALTTTVRVPAGQQELHALDMNLPPGLLGRLTVAPQCAVADAAANRCDAASVIGTAVAKVGVASAPLTVQGKVYLTDGYDGSIAGLMFALPAVVGPIDLGTVVTMAQIKIEGNDLRMRVTASDIPTRVQGIPLGISELAIGMDRPGLMVNPAGCGNFQADIAFASAQGGTAGTTAPYPVGGCNALNWQPGFQIAFSGPTSEMDVKGHPTVSTVITQAFGSGNLRHANVTLPDGLATDPSNINKRICASAQVAVAGGCPAASTIGAAEIITPALPKPVTGSLIIVKVPGQVLPGVMVHVRDQIAFDVVGNTRIESSSGRLQVSFDNLPDTPITKMTMVFSGGATGVLQVGKAFCGVAGTKTDATLTAVHGAAKAYALPTNCNGSVVGVGKEPASKGYASATFRPKGTTSAMTFALSNRNGIRKIVIKMPKGAVFRKRISKKVKLALTGAKAKTRVVNGQRRLAISITPKTPGTKVTKVKFKLPANAIKINVKFRKVLESKKTSKKRKAKLLTKLMAPTITMLDGASKSTTVKTTVKVSTKKTPTKKTKKKAKR